MALKVAVTLTRFGNMLYTSEQTINFLLNVSLIAYTKAVIVE